MKEFPIKITYPVSESEQWNETRIFLCKYSLLCLLFYISSWKVMINDLGSPENSE